MFLTNINKTSYTFLENKHLPDFESKIIKKFNRDEMLSMERELRLTYFLRIESIMKKSPYFKDLYSVSLPKESLYHTEKLRNLRLFVAKYQNTVDYSDRLIFKYTILDPKCLYNDGIYQKYSMSEFTNLLNDARKIIKSVTPNFQILHQRNLQTLENYEIYNSPSCEFVFRLSYYPNRKIWIDILSREE